MCTDDLQSKTIENYSIMVYRLAFSLVKSRCDADDIHQEVFVRYISKNPKFESKEHEKAWFIRVTTNLCKNWWKTAWRRKVISFTEYESQYKEYDIHDKQEGYSIYHTKQYGSAAGTPEQAMLKADASNRVVEIVKTLPQKYRVVIHLFYYEEMSIEEIATVLQMKASTVRTQLTRSRRKLSELLKEEI